MLIRVTCEGISEESREPFLIVCDRLISLLEIAKVIEIGEPVIKTKINSDLLNPDDFKLFWVHYPRKVGKGECEKSYQKEVRAGAKPHDMLRALKRYRQHLETEKVEPKYIKHGSTFLNHWRDWLEPDVGETSVDEKRKAHQAEIQKFFDKE